MMLRIFLSLIFAFLANTPVNAQQEFYPFVAEVSADRVNVRAGQSVNFERLCALDKGAEVVVVEKSYSWYKIKLPRGAQNFISKEFIRLITKTQGEVIANRVNIRAGAGINYTILGQLSKGDKIQILEEDAQWYKIGSDKDSFGWVKTSLLNFKSADVKKFQVRLQKPQVKSATKIKKSSTNKIVKKVNKSEGKSVKNLGKSQVKIPRAHVQESIKHFPVVNKNRKLSHSDFLAPQAKVNKISRVTGILKFFQNKDSKNGQYRLMVNGQPAYFLKAPSYILEEFVFYKVQVEGTFPQSPRIPPLHRVIVVSKIQLMI